jgi:hypothetical protein
LINKGAGRLVLRREHASGHVSLDLDTPTPDALWAIAKNAKVNQAAFGLRRQRATETANSRLANIIARLSGSSSCTGGVTETHPAGVTGTRLAEKLVLESCTGVTQVGVLPESS